MATAFINEYGDMKSDSDGRAVPVPGPLLATQKVTYTTSTASAAFGRGTEFIRIICDAKGHFELGSAPTATANSSYLVADVPEYIGVTAGDKIAVYDGTS